MRFHCLPVLVIYIIFSAGKADALLMNGNFEMGLTGWSTLGDVSVVDSSFGVASPQGHSQVLATNAPSHDPYAAALYEYPPLLSYSGTDSATLFQAEFHTFFDALTLPQFGADEGSGIKQGLTTPVDGLLSFTWKGLTDEGAGLCSTWPCVDTAFYILDDSSYFLYPAGTKSLSPTSFIFEYPYETASIFLPAGLHTLAFGVVDGADHFTNSGLLIDDISFRAVPEPPAWLLLVIGAVRLAWRPLARRR
jgi:hypothetical protein